jgi:hypothetical protein
MNTRLISVAFCTAGLLVASSSAFADRGYYNNDGQRPPGELNGGKEIPDWGIVEFSYDDSGSVGILPHSDGLEPPMADIMRNEIVAPSPLGDPGSTWMWTDQPRDLGLEYGATGVGRISAVPAPGPAALLFGAAGAAAIRRRRR